MANTKSAKGKVREITKKIYKVRRFKHKRSYDGFWKDGVFSK